jgi:hypothetical protein
MGPHGLSVCLSVGPTVCLCACPYLSLAATRDPQASRGQPTPMEKPRPETRETRARLGRGQPRPGSAQKRAGSGEQAPRARRGPHLLLVLLFSLRRLALLALGGGSLALGGALLAAAARGGHKLLLSPHIDALGAAGVSEGNASAQQRAGCKEKGERLNEAWSNTGYGVLRQAGSSRTRKRRDRRASGARQGAPSLRPRPFWTRRLRAQRRQQTCKRAHPRTPTPQRARNAARCDERRGHPDCPRSAPRGERGDRGRAPNQPGPATRMSVLPLTAAVT